MHVSKSGTGCVPPRVAAAVITDVPTLSHQLFTESHSTGHDDNGRGLCQCGHRAYHCSLYLMVTLLRTYDLFLKLKKKMFG